MKLITFFFICLTLVLYYCNEKGTGPPDNQPDTTSHNITWQTFEFGYQSSSGLDDVFILEENNFWCVGEIHTEETDTYDSLGNWIPPYNAMHWDGKEWEFKHIPFLTFCNQQSTGYYSSEAIITFSANDIYFTSGSKMTHLNDLGFTTLECLPVSVNKMWGISNDNYYAVGIDGKIAHYNSQSWIKLESGTDLTLKDIYGFSDGSFYTVGYEEMNGSVIVSYDGSTINTKHYPDVFSNKLSGVWAASKNDVYMVGSGIFKYKNDSLIAREYPENFPKYQMECIRGTAANNIFVAGHGGFVMHYNGKSWKYYPELLQWRVFKSIAVFEKLVVIVGYGNSKAHLVIGRQE